MARKSPKILTDPHNDNGSLTKTGNSTHAPPALHLPGDDDGDDDSDDGDDDDGSAFLSLLSASLIIIIISDSATVRTEMVPLLRRHVA